MQKLSNEESYMNSALQNAKSLLPVGYAIVPITPTPGMEEQAAHNLCAEYGFNRVRDLRQFALDAWGEFVKAGMVR
jgi:hypothetical protein